MFKPLLTKLMPLAALTAGLAIAPHMANAQNAQPVPLAGWHKECAKQADNDVCIVQNIITAPSGQLVTAVGLVQVSGKSNRRLMQVTVPIARFIQPGISLQIDGGKQTKIPYAVCLPDKCIAQVDLTDEIVASFKKGGEAVFTSVNAQRKANPVRVTLKGFTQAFDGDPISRSEKEEATKARQDEIRKKLEESRAKLQAAQDAAKQAQ